MTSWSELLGDRWLWAALLAGGAAQLLGLLLAGLRTRRWSGTRSLSGRAALISGVSAGVGATQGVGSPLFAVCTALGLAVLWNGAEVRLRDASPAWSVLELALGLGIGAVSGWAAFR